MDSTPEFKCIFKRPWMRNNSAAASAEQKGLRGVVAGGLTGAIEVCITYPTEYVKTQLQLDGKGDKQKFNGIIDCVKITVKERGVLGLYKGLSVLLVGSIPKVGCRFGTFEFLKQHAVDERGNLSPRLRLFCGLGAGVSEAVFAVTPMETVKVKFINDQRSEKPKYRGFFQGIFAIFQEYGFGGLYKGVTATVLKQGSNQAIRFFVVETARDLYRKGDVSVNIPKWYIGLVAVFAGAASVFTNAPVDIVKTRMQSFDSHLYKNTLDCVFKIWRNEGLFAFYKGTVPRLTRVCLDVSITFMIYDTIVDVFNIFWPQAW